LHTKCGILDVSQPYGPPRLAAGIALLFFRDVKYHVGEMRNVYEIVVSILGERMPVRRSRFDSRRYQISREVVGPERGPLSLVSTIEELLERKNSGFGLESREYGHRDPSR
jgi:hypothetical protein